jgi:hypothetical protein
VAEASVASARSVTAATSGTSAVNRLGVERRAGLGRVVSAAIDLAARIAFLHAISNLANPLRAASDHLNTSVDVVRSLARRGEAGVTL